VTGIYIARDRKPSLGPGAKTLCFIAITLENNSLPEMGDGCWRFAGDRLGVIVAEEKHAYALAGRELLPGDLVFLPFAAAPYLVGNYHSEAKFPPKSTD
jgi:hypothetical protein